MYKTPLPKIIQKKKKNKQTNKQQQQKNTNKQQTNKQNKTKTSRWPLINMQMRWPLTLKFTFLQNVVPCVIIPCYGITIFIPKLK